MSYFPNLAADLERVLDTYGSQGRARRLLLSLAQYGFMAVAVYRFGRWARTIGFAPFRYPLLAIYVILRALIHILFGIDINPNSNIGPGFYIGHFGCIVVTGDFGSNCSIGQGVTVGYKGAGKSDGYPVIGDNVYIGTGAKVIGSISVGDNVVIGANAVVVKDVPPDSLAVGVPAKICRRDSS